MLPPTTAGSPAACSIRPVSVVVVDFPFVPVMAMTLPFNQRQASSSSPMIGTPRWRTASSAGRFAGTPGLKTTRSARPKTSPECPPRSSVTPAARSLPASSKAERSSLNVTRAPRETSSSAAAIPLRAAPTTTTFWPLTEDSFIRLPKLQRRETEQRKNDRDDQEARDDLWLTPSDQLEMVMQRRHPEHAFAREFERR